MSKCLAHTRYQLQYLSSRFPFFPFLLLQSTAARSPQWPKLKATVNYLGQLAKKIRGGDSETKQRGAGLLGTAKGMSSQ